MSDFRQPGDFAVCPAGGAGGWWIGLGERMAGSGFAYWRHALVYVGGGRVLQAEPGGAQIAGRGVRRGDLWSSGIIGLTDSQRALVPHLAGHYAGAGYSWLDYAAIGLHHLGVPAPGLRAYITSTRHLICSQLADQFEAGLGVHLFGDGRWPGYVMPADLAGVLAERRRPARL